MPDKKYYEELKKKTKEDLKRLDSLIEAAEAWKKVYLATKDRKGVYKFINRLSKWINQKIVNHGRKNALKDLRVLGYEMDYMDSVKK